MNKLLAIAVLSAASACANAATTCSLVSGLSLSFGSYDVLNGTPNDSLTNLTVSCSREGGPANISVTLGLGQGVNGTTVSTRRLGRVGGGDSISYGLYRDVGRSSVWGFSTGTDTMSQVINISNKSSAPATFSIYGRIPASQDVMQGTYTDTVQVTLTP